MFQFLIIVLGLTAFEIISSIDNAIVNAHVLHTVPERARRFFLTWGLLFAVVIVRGILPFAIVWIANPALSFGAMLAVAFGGEEAFASLLHESRPLLLIGGGMYLCFVFLGWLFLEEKKYAFLVEHFIHRHGFWFYAVASFLFTIVIYLAISSRPMLALAASIGSTAFFITDGFRKNAEAKEKQLVHQHLSAWSKILYLEALDISFSIDGVIGAFAFTLSIPLILIGNGIGAIVVRQVTIRGMKFIEKFAYLKNGAMYSIGLLGAIMVVEAFGAELPFWIAPLNTFLLIGFFVVLSLREVQDARRNVA